MNTDTDPDIDLDGLADEIDGQLAEIRPPKFECPILGETVGLNNRKLQAALIPPRHGGDWPRLQLSVLFQTDAGVWIPCRGSSVVFHLRQATDLARVIAKILCVAKQFAAKAVEADLRYRAASNR